MKIINLIFAFNLIADICLSQTTLVPVTFIIEDFDSHKEIVAALVTVRQTALTQPTLANGKVRFENVPVGEIEYYISKEGYQFETGRVNVSSDIKTNNFRIPISKLDDKKILVTGEVTDSEGRDLKDAWVEVKIADQVRTVMSDASGNYSLDIAPSTKFPTSTMRIEVKKGDCKKTGTVDIPRTNVVYKDFKLDCTTEGDTTPTKSHIFQQDEVNGVRISLTKCELIGKKVVCYLLYENISTNPIMEVFICPRGEKMIDENGLMYECTMHSVGNVESRSGTYHCDIIQGTKVKAKMEFIVGDINFTKLASLAVRAFATGERHKFYDIKVVK